MAYKYECFESIQHYAICEFNQYRPALEEMYQSKIKVKKMYWCFGWKILFELEEQQNDR